MIIVCENCNKKFNVDANLIPTNGRQIQCGLCNHSWHYKVPKITSKPLMLNEINDQDVEVLEASKTNDLENTEKYYSTDKINQETIVKINKDHKDNKEITIQKDIKSSKIGNFFSYLVVFIISLVSLIILMDTIKTPLINMFPGMEIILFNLYETLKDVRLFIIDLT